MNNEQLIMSNDENGLVEIFNVCSSMSFCFNFYL